MSKRFAFFSLFSCRYAKKVLPLHRISKNVYAIYEYQNAYIPRRLVLFGRM